MNKKNNRKGFTTVELVIVIAVIAILATVLIPTFSNLIEKAEESNALSEANSVYKNWLADIENVKNFDNETVLLIKTDAGIYKFAENKMSDKPLTETDANALNCKSGIFLRISNKDDSAEEIKAGYVDITADWHKDEPAQGETETDKKCDNCGVAMN